MTEHRVDAAYVEAVLGLVERIPPGRVTSYGAIAEVVGSGARQVGRVMAHHGGGVPWWRVVRADGSLPASHRGEAERRYADEGTPVRRTGAVDMREAFWEPDPAWEEEGGPAFALLPSALLGPAAWEPVAAELSSLGVDAVVAGSADHARESVDDVLRWYRDSLPEEREYVLVPHSNAGLYVPLLAERWKVAASIFVDAALPPTSGAAPVAPAGLRALLAELVDADGRLPVWTSWWDADEISRVLPPESAAERLVAEQVRLPLRYFDDAVPVPAGWSRTPSAYLAFGHTYGDELREAEARGWPTAVLPGEHLHLLVDPPAVARALLDLRARLLARHAANPGS